MTAEVDICNMALANIRAGRINSLTESSTQAENCELFYAICRDQILEDVAWGFATVIEPLGLLDSTVYDIFNWAYVYQYPSDCLKIQRLILNYEQVNTSSSFVTNRIYDIYDYPEPNLQRPIQYEVFDIDGTQVIAANDSELRIKYTTKITDPNKFSSSFKLALSWLISAHIAIPIAGEEKGSKLASNALAMYQKFVNNATANELNQMHNPPPDSEFITVRS